MVSGGSEPEEPVMGPSPGIAWRETLGKSLYLFELRFNGQNGAWEIIYLLCESIAEKVKTIALESDSLRFESITYHLFDLGPGLITQSLIFLFCKMGKLADPISWDLGELK